MTSDDEGGEWKRSNRRQVVRKRPHVPPPAAPPPQLSGGSTSARIRERIAQLHGNGHVLWTVLPSTMARETLLEIYTTTKPMGDLRGRDPRSSAIRIQLRWQH